MGASSARCLGAEKNCELSRSLSPEVSLCGLACADPVLSSQLSFDCLIPRRTTTAGWSSSELQPGTEQIMDAIRVHK